MTSTTTLEVGQNLIHRLRQTASKGVSVWGDLQKEAADAIEALQAEVIGLRSECVDLKRQWTEWNSSLDSVMKQRNELKTESANQQEEIKLLNIRLNTAHDQINGLHAMHQSAKLAFEQVCKHRDDLQIKLEATEKQVPDCSHAKETPHWDFWQCTDCGMIKPDGPVSGRPNGGWFASKESFERWKRGGQL